MSPSGPHSSDLRRHFPTVYLTLISILVALAVEGLLERMDQIETLFVPSAPTFLLWIQITIVLALAAIFWWVIARWASTLPWSVGFFDALMPLLLLVVFHFLAGSIGASATRWFAALGLISIGGALNYLVSALRALGARDDVPDRAWLLAPTAVGLGGGVGFFALSIFAARRDPGVGLQIVLNSLGAVLLVVFSMLEYRAWTRILERVRSTRGDPSPA